MGDKFEIKLLRYIQDFELVDLLGFGAILGVKEDDDFEEYVTQIIYRATKLKRSRRKELLKLAKDISENNREVDRGRKENEIVEGTTNTTS